MSGYTIIDPHCSVVMHTSEDEAVSKIVVRKGTTVLEVPFTDDMLRLMGYYCALRYSKRTRKTAFMPAGFKPPLEFPNYPGPALPEMPAAPVARVRTRTPLGAVADAIRGGQKTEPAPPAPVARPRIRTRTA